MELYPIRTEADYQAALKEVESLFDALPNTPEYDRLDLLSTLVEAYEKVHYPIEAPDPAELRARVQALRDGTLKTLPVGEVLKAIRSRNVSG